MEFMSFNHKKHCRWCGIEYYAKQPVHRDGFCSPRCRQAHHRAFKKYVTTKKPGSRVLR